MVTEDGPLTYRRFWGAATERTLGFGFSMLLPLGPIPPPNGHSATWHFLHILLEPLVQGQSPYIHHKAPW